MVFPGSPPGESGLDAEGRRNWIKYNIPESVWLGQSGTSIHDSLRSVGMGIRTVDFFSIRNSVLGAIEDRRFIAELSADQLVPFGLMREDHGAELSMKGQYRLRLDVIDPDTGELTSIYRSLATDTHHTTNEITDFAGQLFTSGGENYDWEIDTIELEEVWLQPGSTLDR